jgi:hypothetical protein
MTVTSIRSCQVRFAYKGVQFLVQCRKRHLPLVGAFLPGVELLEKAHFPRRPLRNAESRRGNLGHPQPARAVVAISLEVIFPIRFFRDGALDSGLSKENNPGSQSALILFHRLQHAANRGLATLIPIRVSA